MADVYTLAAKFKAELLAGEARAADDLLKGYAQAWRQIEAEANALSLAIDQARAAGEEMSPSWLYRQGRYQRLMDEIAVQVEHLADEASLITREQQFDVIEAAQQQATRLVAEAVPDYALEAGFSGLQRDVAEQVVGNMYADSPIRALFSGLTVEAQTQATNAITTGIIANRPPREIARGIKNAMGGNASRAMTIARTETMRAHREASRNVYQSAGAVLKGWRWVCAHQSRTCALCWAMDGQTFWLDEELGSHPNCRCSMVPVPTDEDPADVPLLGQALFDKQSDDFKLAVLGPSKFDAYERGVLDLGQLVQTGHHPDWGTVRRERSLASAIKAKNPLKPLPKPTPKAPTPTAPKPMPKPKAPAKPPATTTAKTPAKTVDKPDPKAWRETTPREWGSMPAKQAARYEKAVDDMMADYPMMQNELSFFGDYSSLKRRDPAIGGQKPGVYATTYDYKGGSYTWRGQRVERPDRSAIVMNKGRDAKKMQMCLDHDHDHGWLTTGSPEGVVAHEFGHAIHNTLYRKLGKGEVQQRLRAVRGDNGLRTISQYAGESENEFIAEAIADVHVNGDKAHPLSTSVVKEIRLMMQDL